MSLTVLDWRRQVAELYRRVRAAPTPEQGHRVWREGRDRLFAAHPASPLLPEARAGFDGLAYGTYDPALRFEVPVESGLEPVSMAFETGTDGTVGFERIGAVELPGIGQLDVWWLLGYGGGIFLPIADRAPTSYPGGRYLLDTVKGADLGGAFDQATGRGSLVVDLNFAYNPSCAYDPAWACPLAPPGNRVAAAVEAGEHHLAGRLGS